MRSGCSEEERARLTDIGKKFFIERATQQRTTSYTELNATAVKMARCGEAALIAVRSLARS